MLFNTKKRTQELLIATEDLRLIVSALPVEKAYVVDNKTDEAWSLNPSNMIRWRKDSNRTVVPVYEREAAPMSFDGKDSDNRKKFAALVNKIAAESFSQEISTIQKNATKDKMASALRFVVMAFAIVAVVVVMASLILSDKLTWPF